MFEDEGTNIGTRGIPEVLFNKMKQSPIVLLTASLEERLNITYQEYIIEALTEHQVHYGEGPGFNTWAEQLHTSIDKIQRRLGGIRYKELKTILTDAIERQLSTANAEHHKEWIKVFLSGCCTWERVNTSEDWLKIGLRVCHCPLTLSLIRQFCSRRL